MTDIQRWMHGPDPRRDPKGGWVTYADHVEALRQAEQRVARTPWRNNDQMAHYKQGYEQGQRDALATKHHDPGERCDGCWSFATEDALAAAVQRVEACEGASPSHLKVRINLSDAIAAIKGGDHA